MTAIIITTAAAKDAVNAGLRALLGIEGAAITVPLIGVAEPDDAPASYYGANWEHMGADEVRRLREIADLQVWTIGTFDGRLDALQLRRKPCSAIQ